MGAKVSRILNLLWRKSHALSCRVGQGQRAVAWCCAGPQITTLPSVVRVRDLVSILRK
jgi:hypothetical protein